MSCSLRWLTRAPLAVEMPRPAAWGAVEDCEPFAHLERPADRQALGGFTVQGMRHDSIAHRERETHRHRLFRAESKVDERADVKCGSGAWRTVRTGRCWSRGRVRSSTWARLCG